MEDGDSLLKDESKLVFFQYLNGITNSDSNTIEQATSEELTNFSESTTSIAVTVSHENTESEETTGETFVSAMTTTFMSLTGKPIRIIKKKNN